MKKTDKEFIKEFEKEWLAKPLTEAQKSFLLKTRKEDREEFINMLGVLKGKEIEKDKRPINVEIPEDMYVDGYNQAVQSQNKKIDKAIKKLCHIHK